MKHRQTDFKVLYQKPYDEGIDEAMIASTVIQYK